MYFNSRANKLFYQIIGLAILALSGLGLVIWQLSPFFLAAGRGISHQLSTLCGCANHWHFANHPIIFSAMIIGGVLFLGLSGWAFFKITRVITQTHIFINSALKNKTAILSNKLIKAAYQTGLIGKIIEIKKEEPTIFCFGFWQPKICISNSLIKRLNPAELTAVLLHEKQHLLACEPAKAMLIKILSHLLFFLPGFLVLTTKYLTYSELAADERATANFKNKVPLAHALYKIIKWKESRITKQYLALSFFGEITEERVNKLVDDNYQLKIKIFTGRIFLELSFLVIGLGLLFFSPRLASAQQETLACLEMLPATGMAEIQCHWPTTKADDCSVLNQYTSTHSSCVE
ncbi:MAG: M56 family metallopeptidase [Patescibacteria group bacterium]